MMNDKVLIKPKSPQERTKSGLYLPPSVEIKEKIHSGYVIKVGPGFPMPAFGEPEETWTEKSSENTKYIPIQPQIGDLAIYLQSSSYEVAFHNETYIIVPSSAILMLVRDEGLVD